MSGHQDTVSSSCEKGNMCGEVDLAERKPDASPLTAGTLDTPWLIAFTRSGPLRRSSLRRDHQAPAVGRHLSRQRDAPGHQRNCSTLLPLVRVSPY